MRAQASKPRGVLKAPMDAGHFRHARYLPAEDLAFFIDHFWIVTWDLRGLPPVTREVLSHPSVHLLFESGLPAQVAGLHKGRFVRALEGEGHVFGIKFRPGAFHPFLNASVTSLTGKVLPLEKLFGEAGEALDAEMCALGKDEDEAKIQAAERFLRRCHPERDAMVDLIGRLVARIIEEPTLTQVDELVNDSGLSKRALQRVFSVYVGLSPKWMIQRYRLHEALERIAGPSVPDWSRLALELGYFDQAHFIRDFKALVGRTPTEYSRIGQQASAQK